MPHTRINTPIKTNKYKSYKEQKEVEQNRIQEKNANRLGLFNGPERTGELLRHPRPKTY